MSEHVVPELHRPDIRADVERLIPQVMLLTAKLAHENHPDFALAHEATQLLRTLRDRLT